MLPQLRERLLKPNLQKLRQSLLLLKLQLKNILQELKLRKQLHLRKKIAAIKASLKTVTNPKRKAALIVRL